VAPGRAQPSRAGHRTSRPGDPPSRGARPTSSRNQRQSLRMEGMSRVERRRAIKARRARVGLAASLAASVVIVAAWFPASELMHQRQQLGTTTTQLDQLRKQDAALAKEQTSLKSSPEISRIAREQFQLVTHGTTPYQVLPKEATSVKSKANQGYPSDPGTQPPVVPSGDVELPPGTGDPVAHPGVTGSSTFFGRILQTLEFWR
jgi:cell division protein FtsB